MAMEVSERGIRLIAEFEGFSPTPYNDPVGHCTVGYGELLHLGPCTQADMARPPMTPAEGRARLREKVKPYAAAVLANSPPLTQNQFDALTSLTYNIGQAGYIRSSVRRAVIGGGDVRAALMLYVKGTDGVTYPGLVRRRRAEADLYETPVTQEEDEMWVRANGTAPWWTKRALKAGEGTMQLAIDFPALPASAKAVDIEVFMNPASRGTFVLRDGDGMYAGQVNARRLQSVIRVVPKDRTVRFGAEGGDVEIDLLGIVGYVA